jgi:hypothetical protein
MLRAVTIRAFSKNRSHNQQFLPGQGPSRLSSLARSLSLSLSLGPKQPASSSKTRHHRTITHRSCRNVILEEEE